MADPEFPDYYIDTPDNGPIEAHRPNELTIPILLKFPNEFGYAKTVCNQCPLEHDNPNCPPGARCSSMLQNLTNSHASIYFLNTTEGREALKKHALCGVEAKLPKVIKLPKAVPKLKQPDVKFEKMNKRKPKWDDDDF